MAYVFFDIDGTIYEYSSGVSESTRDAIRALKAGGHHPIICTGRTKIVIPDQVLDIGFDGIVAGGGSLVEWMGKEIHRDIMPGWVAKKLIHVLKRNGFSCYPEGHDDMYYETEMGIDGLSALWEIFHVSKPEHYHPIDFSTDMKISKISALYTPSSNRDRAIAEMGPHFDWVDHMGRLFETVPKHTSKIFGIKTLMNYLEESMDDTYAFGDSFNDLGMLQLVQVGIAMGNAKASLLEMIPWHTDTIENDGIAKGLKNFGLI